MPEAFFEADEPVLLEHVGMNVCLHGIMLLGGLEILPYCHHLAVDGA